MQFTEGSGLHAELDALLKRIEIIADMYVTDIIFAKSKCLEVTSQRKQDYSQQ